jgi:hypothetical protein
MPSVRSSVLAAGPALAGACRNDQGVGDHPGPEYTSMLTEFVTHVWHPERAADRAPSLRRALSDVTARFA